MKSGVCKRETTCFECDNKMCWLAGSAEADCIRIDCIYDMDFDTETCLKCRYNINSRKRGKRNDKSK